VHGTYPYPTAATPNRTPGGYTTEQWQWMMDNPELYPELVDVQEYGDTKYITVTPTVLPLVAPLHGTPLKPLADLIEPALRVLIEQTGYNRDLPFGQLAGFRLIPIFNPVKLALDLVAAVPQGINQMLAGLRGEPTWIVPAPPETLVSDSSDTTATTPELTATQSVPDSPSASEPAQAPQTENVAEVLHARQPVVSDAQSDDDSADAAENASDTGNNDTGTAGDTDTGEDDNSDKDNTDNRTPGANKKNTDKDTTETKKSDRADDSGADDNAGSADKAA
jgi:hypothetical protein